jgi:aminoglycoside/choline kinase family phosphotransferase
LRFPAPPFALVQNYETPKIPVLHADLYRLSDPQGTAELGLDDASEDGIVIVEWPEQGDLGFHGGPRLDVRLEVDARGHAASLSGSGDWTERLTRLAAARDFLKGSGYGGWTRQSLSGDASARRYEILTAPDGETAQQRLLMDSPAIPDPGTGTLPYSRIVHLAEDIVPFLAIGASLRHHGFAAPAIHAADPENGFAILEHLGAGSIVENGRPVADRYQTAMDCVVALQDAMLPKTANWERHHHALPRFDRSVFHAEAELVLDWYIPHVSGSEPTLDCRSALAQALDSVLEAHPILEPPLSWVLRDYHSPNIIWRGDATGTNGIGLIDFQDALVGPAAYDAASLAYDARIDMPVDLSEALIDTYLLQGAERISAFDPDVERVRVAAFAAQRNLKILGIFARLAKRDNKPAYLKHIPRIQGYLRHVLAEPALAPIRSWSVEHLDLEGR